MSPPRLSLFQAARRCDAAGDVLGAGKKQAGTRHTIPRELTGTKTAITTTWKNMTLPYVEDGICRIRRNEIAPFHQ